MMTSLDSGDRGSESCSIPSGGSETLLKEENSECGRAIDSANDPHVLKQHMNGDCLLLSNVGYSALPDTDEGGPSARKEDDIKQRNIEGIERPQTDKDVEDKDFPKLEGGGSSHGYDEFNERLAKNSPRAKDDAILNDDTQVHRSHNNLSKPLQKDKDDANLTKKVTLSQVEDDEIRVSTPNCESSLQIEKNKEIPCFNGVPLPGIGNNLNLNETERHDVEILPVSNSKDYSSSFDDCETTSLTNIEDMAPFGSQDKTTSSRTCRKKDIDSGWAWVVLFASYMNLFLLSGVCYMGGMFQVVFLEEFNESVGFTAWVTALFASLMLLAGPLTSVITSYSNCRVSVMTGGVLLAGGLAGSSFTSSLYGMFVSFGIIAGLGLGLSYTPTVVVVNFYFEKKRTLVTSVALSASGTGLMLAPLILQYLLDHFAWRECLVILAGICIHVTLFGALMFPLHEKTSKLRLCSRCKGTESFDVAEDIASSQLLNDRESHEITFTVSVKEADVDSNSQRSRLRTREKTRVNQLEIFKNWAFLIFCLNQFLSNAACGIFNIHLPAFCESYGSTTAQIAVILSVNGPANMVSRVLLGAFAHASEKDVWILYFGVLLVSGIIFCLIPIVARTYAAQLIAVILIGTYLGGSYSLPPVLTIECVGLERLAAAFGVTLICGGSAWLVAPPIAGWFVDVTGSYDYSMYLAGMLMLVSVLVGLVVPQMVKPENEYRSPGAITVTVESPDVEKPSKNDPN